MQAVSSMGGVLLFRKQVNPFGIFMRQAHWLLIGFDATLELIGPNMMCASASVIKHEGVLLYNRERVDPFGISMCQAHRLLIGFDVTLKLIALHKWKCAKDKNTCDLQLQIITVAFVAR